VSPPPRLGVHPWLDPYAMPTAVPGGGCAAAVAGALGCALLAMAGRVGARKAGRERAGALGRLAAEADALRAEFLVREALDADAYERRVLTARSARAAAGEERAARAAAAAAVEAVRVPLGTAQLACRGLDLTAELAGKGLARTASDQLIAVHLLLAALEGGLAAATVGLAELADPGVHAELTARRSELADARRVGREAAVLLEALLP
jgi:formiminotetrahydrofolate cyclodeaminase